MAAGVYRCSCPRPDRCAPAVSGGRYNGRVSESGGTRPRHFSMIRDFHLADFLTLANGCCGMAAVFLAMDHVRAASVHKLYAAGLLVLGALVFDFMDGRAARWRHAASPMGRELDSLADVISFGVAPAGIAFAAGLNNVLERIILLYFVGCGLSRLARYNITAESLAGETGKV